jgi:hypothetical protein
MMSAVASEYNGQCQLIFQRLRTILTSRGGFMIAVPGATARVFTVGRPG